MKTLVIVLLDDLTKPIWNKGFKRIICTSMLPMPTTSPTKIVYERLAI